MVQRSCGGVNETEDDITWDISPHTTAKHNILKKYVQAWAPILALGSKHRRFVYIDGFSGPGEYKGGEDGSPILVLKSIKGHQLSEKLSKKEFVNIFIEKRKDRCENLRNVIEKRVSPVPDWIKYDVVNSDFNSEMKRILDRLESNGEELAPCFCFVDPFGWDDIDYDVLAKVMKYEKAELLITFMAGYLERFVWDPKHIPSIGRLYTEEQINNIKNKERGENLVTKYFLENLMAKIKGSGVNGSIYDLSFATYNRHNRLEYYLIYLTKSCKGLEVMKSAMFNSAKDGSYKFSDFEFDPNQTTLVDYGQEQQWIEFAADEVYKKFVSTYGTGNRIPISSFKGFVTCQSKWIFKKEILKKLEEAGRINVIAEKRRKGTFPERSFIVLN